MNIIKQIAIWYVCFSSISLHAMDTQDVLRLSHTVGRKSALVIGTAEPGRFKILIKEGQYHTEFDNVWVTKPGRIRLFNWDVQVRDQNYFHGHTEKLLGFLLSSKGDPKTVTYPAELHILNKGKKFSYTLDSASDIAEVVSKNVQEFFTYDGLELDDKNFFIIKKLLIQSFGELVGKEIPFKENFPIKLFQRWFEYESTSSDIFIGNHKAADIRQDLLNLPLEGTHHNANYFVKIEDNDCPAGKLVRRIRGLQLAALARVREDNSWSKEDQYPVPHPQMVQLKLAIDRVVAGIVKTEKWEELTTEHYCGLNWPAVLEDDDEFMVGLERDGQNDMSAFFEETEYCSELSRLESDRKICYEKQRLLFGLYEQHKGIRDLDTFANALSAFKIECMYKKRKVQGSFIYGMMSCQTKMTFPLDEGDVVPDMTEALEKLNQSTENESFRSILREYEILDPES